MNEEELHSENSNETIIKENNNSPSTPNKTKTKEDDDDNIFAMSPLNKRKTMIDISSEQLQKTQLPSDDNFNSLTRSWSRGVPSGRINPKYHTLNPSTKSLHSSYSTYVYNNNIKMNDDEVKPMGYRNLTQSLILKKSTSDMHITKPGKWEGHEDGMEDDGTKLSSSTPSLNQNVFIHTPPSTSPMSMKRDEVVDDLVFVSRDFLPVIKGGTLEKLIERLTYDSSTEWDSDYIDAFLLTYKSYITSKELLDRLFIRYTESVHSSSLDAPVDESKQKIIKIRVTNVLKRWVMDYYHDFVNDESLVKMFKEGIKQYISDSSSSMLEKCLDEQIQKVDKFRKKEFIFAEKPPTPMIPKTQIFEDFDVSEMARQLCLYQQRIYQSIHPKEALNQSWNKYKERSPNIIRMIQFFNKLSRWVATKIVLEENIKDRIKMAKKILKLCGYLKDYNNFDGVQAILAGFNNSAIYRLKHTWEKLQKSKDYHVFLECKDLMDTSKSYSNYRKKVETSDPPIIPYLGVYLTDLTFIEDGNPDYLIVKGDREDIINFDKMRKVAAVIKQICLYQQTPYNFVSVETIQNFIENMNPLDDKEAFERSKVLEPSIRNSPQRVQSLRKKKVSSKFLSSSKK